METMLWQPLVPVSCRASSPILMRRPVSPTICMSRIGSSPRGGKCGRQSLLECEIDRLDANLSGSGRRLFAWKSLLSIHNYDIYDLATTWRKSVDLARWPAVPFGVLTMFALAAIVLRKKRESLIPMILFAAATVAALIVFNVSARQRDALLPPLAILAAIGVMEIISSRRIKLIVSIVVVVAGSYLLSVDGPPQREDRYGWWAISRASLDLAMGHPAEAAVLRTAYPPAVDGQSLQAAAKQMLLATKSPEVRFDAALALENANDWADADACW